MPQSRNSTNTNFWYFRCKTHYSRIDNSSIYVNIKIYLTILTSLIFLDICIPVPVSLIFETSLAFMTATASLVLFLVHWQMMKRCNTLLKVFVQALCLPVLIPSFRMCQVEPSFCPSYRCVCTFCPLDGSNHIFVSDSRRPLTISFFL